MKMLLSAWPALALLLPVLWLVSVIVFLAKGNRRAVAQLMALLACFLIGALLMDQSVLAGVGNVYRSELLFRHGIDPYRPGRDIDESEFLAAWADLVDLMKVGVRRGRIIVMRPEDDHGAPSYGPNRPRTYVYRRAGEPCRLCATPVRTAVMEARNLFWCPGCQA